MAAIVLDSSKVTGIVGHKNPEGGINVLAYVAMPSTDIVSKGVVYNVEKMQSTIKSIRERLEEKVNCTIQKFYVAITCRGIRSVSNEVDLQYHERETITRELLNQYLVTNKSSRPNDRTFIEIIPQEYKLGSIVTTDPIGVVTDNVHATYLNIMCGTVPLEMIENSFRRAEVEIARTVIGATQLSTIFTTEQERTSGCAFVEMGSETIAVAVYKGKLLRHFAILPLGAASITRDIAKVFNCSEEEAEQLRDDYGYPDEKLAASEEMIKLRDGGREQKVSELALIIDARVEELVQNIKHQIELSGYHREDLVNGLCITGEGSQLRGMNRAFDRHFRDWSLRMPKMPARLSVSCLDRNFNDSGLYNTALAVVMNGEIDCNGGERKMKEEPSDLFSNAAPAAADVQHDAQHHTSASEVQEEPKRKQKSGLSRFFGGLKKRINDFVNQEETE